MIRLAIIFNDKKLSGRLTHAFTGCYAYHCGFVDLEGDRFWDMHRLFRCVPWKGRYAPHQVVLAATPVLLTAEQLDREVLERVRLFCEPGGMLKAFYGVRDYVLFALRPLYHLLGKSTRNYGGEICSEVLNTILVKHGWTGSPWPADSAPCSPCDWWRWLFNNRLIEVQTAE